MVTPGELWACLLSLTLFQFSFLGKADPLCPLGFWMGLASVTSTGEWASLLRPPEMPACRQRAARLLSHGLH